jgi:hypothetical protein
MTPKDKAKDLIYSFNSSFDTIHWTEDKDLITQAELINDLDEVKEYWNKLAKKQALICVNGLLEVLIGKEVFESEYKYYQEVKKYISYE